MFHLYFSRYKLFNYKYVHIVITNTLHLNKYFLFSFFFYKELLYSSLIMWLLRDTTFVAGASRKSTRWVSLCRLLPCIHRNTQLLWAATRSLPFDIAACSGVCCKLVLAAHPQQVDPCSTLRCKWILAAHPAASRSQQYTPQQVDPCCTPRYKWVPAAYLTASIP